MIYDEHGKTAKLMKIMTVENNECDENHEHMNI